MDGRMLNPGNFHVQIKLPKEQGGEVMAEAHISLSLKDGGYIVLRSLYLGRSEEGPFLSWPARQEKGQFKDYYEFDDPDAREKLKKAVIKMYTRHIRYQKLVHEYVTWWRVEKEVGAHDSATTVELES